MAASADEQGEPAGEPGASTGGAPGTGGGDALWSAATVADLVNSATAPADTDRAATVAELHNGATAPAAADRAATVADLQRRIAARRSRGATGGDARPDRERGEGRRAGRDRWAATEGLDGAPDDVRGAGRRAGRSSWAPVDGLDDVDRGTGGGSRRGRGRSGRDRWAAEGLDGDARSAAEARRAAEAAGPGAVGPGDEDEPGTGRGRSSRRRRAGQQGPRRGDEDGQPAGPGEPEGGRGGRRGSPAIDADPVAAAKEICLRLLTDRARTRQELAQALHRKGVPDEAAEAVLSRFGEVGLIDDAAFAGQWVRSRSRHRGLARRAIAMELRRKGVDDEVAGEALAEIDDAAEEARARALVEQKLRSMTVETPEQSVAAARRLVGMLARKGYGSGIAYGVVKAALAEHGTELDD